MPQERFGDNSSSAFWFCAAGPIDGFWESTKSVARPVLQARNQRAQCYGLKGLSGLGCPPPPVCKRIGIKIPAATAPAIILKWDKPAAGGRAPHFAAKAQDPCS